MGTHTVEKASWMNSVPAWAGMNPSWPAISAHCILYQKLIRWTTRKASTPMTSPYMFFDDHSTPGAFLLTE